MYTLTEILKKTKKLLQLFRVCCILIWYCRLNYVEVYIVPNIKSAKKRVKVAEKKTQINVAHKTALKTAVKKFETAVAEGDKENAKVLFNDAVKKLDKGVSQGILHKNAAARKKSQLAVKLAKLEA